MNHSPGVRRCEAAKRRHVVARGVNPPRKRQAAVDQALKARHFYSLGREPQEPNAENRGALGRHPGGCGVSRRHPHPIGCRRFAALFLFVGQSPGAHAPGYVYATASRLTRANCRRMSLESKAVPGAAEEPQRNRGLPKNPLCAPLCPLCPCGDIGFPYGPRFECSRCR